MKSTLLIGIIATITIAVAGAAIGIEFVSAQMADNATMGNMTGGNMTMDMGDMTSDSNSTASGQVSGVGGVL